MLAEDQVGGPILPRAEADIVFGKLTPIYQLHKRLQSRLAELESTWNMETSRLGEIVLPYIDEMEKVYLLHRNSYQLLSLSMTLIYLHSITRTRSFTDLFKSLFNTYR